MTNMTTTLAKMFTNNPIKNTTNEGILHWTNENTNAFSMQHNTKDRPTEMPEEAIKEQNDTGWNNFLKGRISGKWVLAQQEHCRARSQSFTTKEEIKQAQKHTAMFFQTTLMREMFKAFEKLWEARNRDCHDLTAKENEPQSLRMQRMHSRVRAMHTEATEMLTTDDKKLFEKDTETTLQKRPMQLEKWTTDAGKVLQKAFEENETLDKHPITDCFPVLSTTNDSNLPPIHLQH